jgi:hypothetical protein
MSLHPTGKTAAARSSLWQFPGGYPQRYVSNHNSET